MLKLLKLKGAQKDLVQSRNCESKKSEGKQCPYFGLVPLVVSRCILESVSVPVAIVFIRSSPLNYQMLPESCHQVVENGIESVWPRCEL